MPLSSTRKSGVVIRLLRDKAYGFIKVDGEKDYFFHATGLSDCTLDDLHDATGDDQPTAVSFVVGTNKRGQLQAQDVRIEG